MCRRTQQDLSKDLNTGRPAPSQSRWHQVPGIFPPGWGTFRPEGFKTFEDWAAAEEEQRHIRAENEARPEIERKEPQLTWLNASRGAEGKRTLANFLASKAGAASASGARGSEEGTAEAPE